MQEDVFNELTESVQQEAAILRIMKMEYALKEKCFLEYNWINLCRRSNLDVTRSQMALASTTYHTWQQFRALHADIFEEADNE